MIYDGKYIDSNETLTFLIENHILDFKSVTLQIEELKRKNYLNMHNHKIWQSNTDHKWYTYVEEEGVLKLRKRNTKEELEAYLIKYYKDREFDPRFPEVFRCWNDERLKYGEISPQTYHKYQTTYQRFFTKNCFLCKKKMRLITEEDLETFIKESIHDYELTYKSYSDLRTVLRGTFMYGKKHGFTNISATTFFGDLSLSPRIFKKRIVKKEKEVFNEDEVALLSSYLWKRGTIRDLGILLAFQTGVRVGELSTLKISDIDEARRSIHVQRTEVTYKDPETQKRVWEAQEFPKTEAGDRYLMIPKAAVTTINAILALNKDGEFLFEEDGKRIHSNAFNRRLTRVCDDLNIPHRSMHKIRKTYCTNLLDHNVDDRIVADQAGHKDVEVTRKFYYFSKANEETKRRQIDRAFGE